MPGPSSETGPTSAGPTRGNPTRKRRNRVKRTRELTRFPASSLLRCSRRWWEGSRSHRAAGDDGGDDGLEDSNWPPDGDGAALNGKSFDEGDVAVASEALVGGESADVARVSSRRRWRQRDRRCFGWKSNGGRWLIPACRGSTGRGLCWSASELRWLGEAASSLRSD